VALGLAAWAGCAPNVQNVAACFQCGTGTEVQAEVCVASGGTCGAGTRWANGACQLDSSSRGAGAALVNGRCEVTAAACGGGLVLAGGRCQLPTPAPLVRSFLDRPGAVISQLGHALVYSVAGGVQVRMRHVKTELTATDASAWVAGAAPMVGNGLALHFSGRLESPYNQEESAAAIFDDTNPDGSCSTAVRPDWAEGLHVGLYTWAGGQAQPVVCARTGSIRIVRNSIAVTLSISALFGDGNTYQETVSLPVAN
jgi:hypothetical protein